MQENNLDVLSEQEIYNWLTTPELSEPERHSELRAIQETVADLAWAVPMVNPPASLRERLLARVAAEKAAPFVSPALLSVRSDEGEWREIAPGVEFKKLFVDKAKDLLTGLYRLAPGATIEAHRHRGHEQTYILEGDCRVGDLMLGAGDFHCAQAGSLHETLSTVNGTLLLIMSPLEYEAVA
jgi:anti-sigma factor ChrR (cupin superfamily)